MRKNNKIIKFGWLYFWGFLILLLGAFLWNNFKWDGKNDLKIGIITDEKISVLVLSPERRMINRVEMKPDTPVLINGGYGWYEANKIRKLLKQEKKENLTKEIFFYNFGVLVDQVEWKETGFTVENLGILGYLKFRLTEDNYLSNREVLSDDKLKNEILLDEIALRDLADNRILSSDFKISVYNDSEVSGLAAFMGKRLDWMGLTVIETSNAGEGVDNCRIVNGSDFLVNKLKDIWNCELVKDEKLGDDQMEIYFGEKFAEMLEY